MRYKRYALLVLCCYGLSIYAALAQTKGCCTDGEAEAFLNAVETPLQGLQYYALDTTFEQRGVLSITVTYEVYGGIPMPLSIQPAAS